MRVNFRAKFGGFTFYMLFSHYQTLEGVANIYDKERKLYYPFFDIEGCLYEDCVCSLRAVMNTYKLADIFITTDTETTFRAWCFGPIPWKTYLKCLLDTQYLDYNFFYWTVKRGHAVLRTGIKKDRAMQYVKTLIHSPFNIPYTIPDRISQVIYDTGLKKRGRWIVIG